MESFHTKDCNHSKVSSPKFESFESKDSDLDESTNEISESFDTKLGNDTEVFDRKFESFESKDSEPNKPVDGVSESFDRKIQSFVSKDSYNTRKVSRKDCKLDGRSGIRSVKQIEAYKRNFCKADSIELKVGELDVRMKHLQSLVLDVLRGRKTKNNIII